MKENWHTVHKSHLSLSYISIKTCIKITQSFWKSSQTFGVAPTSSLVLSISHLDKKPLKYADTDPLIVWQQGKARRKGRRKTAWHVDWELNEQSSVLELMRSAGLCLIHIAHCQPCLLNNSKYHKDSTKSLKSSLQVLLINIMYRLKSPLPGVTLIRV